MAPPRRAFVVFVLLVAPLLAGCMGGTEEDEGLGRADWQVGDRWVFLRSGESFESVYVREVTSLYQKGGQQVFELQEGIQGHRIQQYGLYTVGRLQFMGMEVRDGGDLRTRLDPLEPLRFHYVFPMVPGDVIKESGRIRQTSGELEQLDTVEIEARVDPVTPLEMGDRVYQVYPYEIRIRYTTTPFDDVAVIRGHWSPGVGQSVLTTITESGSTLTYELLSFSRDRPVDGAPVYGLAGDLKSRALTRGFDASIAHPGYTRHLFHVEGPTTVGVSFSTPTGPVRAHTDRIDFAAIRPLGYARAGIAGNITEVTEPGVAMHLAAARAGDPAVVLHSPSDAQLKQIRLEPGQVYELLVASNTGPVRAEVHLGSESQRLQPVEEGRAQALAVRHERVQRTLDPGPQSVDEHVEAIVAVSEDSKIEGVVYAVDHGSGDIVDLEADRRVSYTVDGHDFQDPDAVYGFYLGYRAREPFTVAAGFAYRAELTVQATVDYELGVFLLRLLPPDPGSGPSQ